MTGHYTFALSGEAADHLAQGEKFDFHFTSTVTDQHGAQAHHMIGVTVEGANDRPSLSLNETHLQVTERGADNPREADSVSGKATSSDVDHGAELHYGLLRAIRTWSPLSAAIRPFWKATAAPAWARASPALPAFTAL